MVAKLSIKSRASIIRSYIYSYERGDFKPDRLAHISKDGN